MCSGARPSQRLRGRSPEQAAAGFGRVLRMVPGSASGQNITYPTSPSIKTRTAGLGKPHTLRAPRLTPRPKRFGLKPSLDIESLSRISARHHADGSAELLACNFRPTVSDLHLGVRQQESREMCSGRKGRDPGHYEIVPSRQMTPADYQGLLHQVQFH